MTLAGIDRLLEIAADYQAARAAWDAVPIGQTSPEQRAVWYRFEAARMQLGYATGMIRQALSELRALKAGEPSA